MCVPSCIQFLFSVLSIKLHFLRLEFEILFFLLLLLHSLPNDKSDNDCNMNSGQEIKEDLFCLTKILMTF